LKTTRAGGVRPGRGMRNKKTARTKAYRILKLISELEDRVAATGCVNTETKRVLKKKWNESVFPAQTRGLFVELDPPRVCNL
jgi:hypothetical protein